MIVAQFFLPRVPAKSTRRMGVTVMEVLFAMVIALIGLSGVLAILPMASRQAQESYMMNRATSEAMGAASQAQVMNALTPSSQSMWVFDDDTPGLASVPAGSPYKPPLNNYSGATYNYKAVRSLRDFYDGLLDKQVRESGASTPEQIETVRRRIIGQGFCFDPFYFGSVNFANWAAQGKTWTSTYNAGAHIFRRNRLPFYNEQTSLGSGQLAVDGTVQFVPGLIRVSKLGLFKGTFAPSPLNAAAAQQVLSSVSDIVQATIEDDKSFGAIREFSGVDDGSILATATKGDLTWMATLVPVESKSITVPNQFMVTIVVMQSRIRDVDFPENPTTRVVPMPTAERIALVTSQQASVAIPAAITDLPISSGGLIAAKLHSDIDVDSSIDVGSYVMLSRVQFWNLPDTMTQGPKWVHKHDWYRVVAVDDGSAWPRNVILQGANWEYPDMNALLNQPVPGTTMPTPLPGEVRTVATLLPDVVAVYKFPVSLGNAN